MTFVRPFYTFLVLILLTGLPFFAHAQKCEFYFKSSNVGGASALRVSTDMLDSLNPIETQIKYPKLTMDTSYESEFQKRPWMERSRVKNKQSLERMRLKLYQDRFYNSNGVLLGRYIPVDYIYVMDSKGNIYIHKPQIFFHHSSFGVEVAAAGHLTIFKGQLVVTSYPFYLKAYLTLTQGSYPRSSVNRRSGHYLPNHEHLYNFITALKKRLSPEHFRIMESGIISEEDYAREYVPRVGNLF